MCWERINPRSCSGKGKGSWCDLYVIPDAAISRSRCQVSWKGRPSCLGKEASVFPTGSCLWGSSIISLNSRVQGQLPWLPPSSLCCLWSLWCSRDQWFCSYPSHILFPNTGNQDVQPIKPLIVPPSPGIAGWRTLPSLNIPLLTQPAPTTNSAFLHLPCYSDSSSVESHHSVIQQMLREAQWVSVRSQARLLKVMMAASLLTSSQIWESSSLALCTSAATSENGLKNNTHQIMLHKSLEQSQVSSKCSINDTYHY